ncbi:MAG: helix-turn-helix transcriptional regulator [Acidobacteriia bacterium]|nr:helix-turn-helix transcriptional regulator [Terriglobia bacterium]
MSQVEVAHEFGIDRGHISAIENGKKNVCLRCWKCSRGNSNSQWRNS